MDNLSSMLKMQTLNRDVKDKLLRYIQTWAIATDGKPSLSYVSQTYRSLKGEGTRVSCTSSDMSVIDHAHRRLCLPTGRPHCREQSHGRHANSARMDRFRRLSKM